MRINKLQTKETHVREYTRLFDGREVNRILAQAVADEAGVALDDVTLEINCDMETEGSPSYPTGRARARVTLIQNLMPKDDGLTV